MRDRTIPNNPTFHPFAREDRVRSLNMVNRRKEHERINTDNIGLLIRLKNTRPIILNNEDVRTHIKK